MLRPERRKNFAHCAQHLFISFITETVMFSYVYCQCNSKYCYLPETFVFARPADVAPHRAFGAAMILAVYSTRARQRFAVAFAV